MSVIDIWVNLLPEAAARTYLGDAHTDAVEDLFGSDVTAGSVAEELLETMDGLGVDAAVLTGGISPGSNEDSLALADKHPGRVAVAGLVDDPARPSIVARRVRELALNPRFAMVRVAPLVHQIPLNDRVFYPVYAACEEAGLPVGINVGLPGPPVRSACQDPVLLEDVLIDFPELVVIGSHMGHPFEARLIQYMMKWPNLFLSNSAYLSTYMDPALVRFMGSSRGIGRVLFASDHPVLPMGRALEAARALPLQGDAMDAFLGGTARRLLARSLTP